MMTLRAERSSPRSGPVADPVLDVEEVRNALGLNDSRMFYDSGRIFRRRPDDVVEDDDDFLRRLHLRHADFLEFGDDRGELSGQAIVRGDGDDLAARTGARFGSIPF